MSLHTDLALVSVDYTIAESAYRLATPRLINGVPFDGTSDITISGGGSGGQYVDLLSVQTIDGQKTFSLSPIIPTAATSSNTTIAASTAFVKAQGYITGNQTISLSGDATGSGTTSIAITLQNSGVTAGSYPKVTVDAKGRVTYGTTLIASDIPSITQSKISDFSSAVTALITVGTIASQNFNAVNITGGSITGLTTFDAITIDGGSF